LLLVAGRGTIILPIRERQELATMALDREEFAAILNRNGLKIPEERR
jgi:hypothetical protein